MRKKICDMNNAAMLNILCGNLTMFPLRLCQGKPLVAVTRERRYGPSRLRVNDDGDDDIICIKLTCRDSPVTWGPIYKISYDLSYDYRKFIVRST